MKTSWDYTDLAEAYLKRPGYSSQALDKFVALARLPEGAAVCDIGAGVAHLTLEWLKRGFQVTAVEPNDAMRKLGSQRTGQAVQWHEATAECSGQPSGSFDCVSFGSSFNVTDQTQALRESHRLLRPDGWFVCMWNHRDLDDPVQAEIEAIIREAIPDYDYGARRQDQSAIIAQSGLFGSVSKIEGPVLHTMQRDDVIEAWRSHATLQRQAGPRFTDIVARIEAYLANLPEELIVPYTTRMWCAARLTAP